jgi:hypothetical protein
MAQSLANLSLGLLCTKQPDVRVVDSPAPGQPLTTSKAPSAVLSGRPRFWRGADPHFGNQGLHVARPCHLMALSPDGSLVAVELMMRRSLSYADAAKMLGGSESRVVKILERASVTGGPLIPGINLIGVCKEIIKLGEEILNGLGERLRGLDRMSRTERLRAAHTVIVLTAYFETLDESLDALPAAYKMRLAQGEQLSLAGGDSVDTGWRGIAAALSSMEPVAPVPVRSYEAILVGLEEFYVRLSGNVAEFVASHPRWDQLSEDQRASFAQNLHRSAPRLAVSRYEQLFRRLIA